MVSEKQKVVIIGGGITGLTSAYYLQEIIKKKHLPLEIKLIEANRRLGGKIQTLRRDGYMIEKGPDSFLARKTSAVQLAEKVGIKNELIHNTTRNSYVLAKNKLFSVPEGAVIGIPTNIKPFIFSGLFSVMGKLRASADLIIPRSKVQTDVSLGSFFRRRFGDEMVENLIEPLLSGIYAGDIDQLSLQSTFPQFYEAERKHRSLILGTRKASINSGTEGFFTFKNGLESLVTAVENKLDSSSILKGVRVERIEKDRNEFYIELNNGERLNAVSVIAALPHYLLPTIFSKYEFFRFLSNIPATSVATVSMAFSEQAVKKPINGSGFVVSRNSDYSINACTLTHKKWPHTAPKGKVLLRSHIGRVGDETVVGLSDTEIEQVVYEDLQKLLEITEKPDFTIISRWNKAMPQYTIGHKDRVDQLNEKISRNLSGLFIAGSSFNGIGIPDCIDQGERAAGDVIRYLKSFCEN